MCCALELGDGAAARFVARWRVAERLGDLGDGHEVERNARVGERRVHYDAARGELGEESERGGQMATRELVVRARLGDG